MLCFTVYQPSDEDLLTLPCCLAVITHDVLVALQYCCCIDACGRDAGSRCRHCTKIQPHAGKLPQAATQGCHLICATARLLVLSTWCFTSVRRQKIDIFIHYCNQVHSYHYQDHVICLKTSWMETLMISLRMVHSKLSEPAQPTHCPEHLGSNFSSPISSLLQGWMNYVRFLGLQTGKMELQSHVISATFPSLAS